MCTKDECVLVLGAEGSGKSLFIRRIKELAKFEDTNGAQLGEKCELSPESTIPTVGVDLITVNLTKENAINVREVGATMASRWNSYIPESSCIIFVVDVADLGSLSAAYSLLAEVLSSYDTIQSCRPFALALNKLDIADSTSTKTVSNILRIDEIKNLFSTFIVLSGSSIDGSLAANALAWLRSVWT